MKLERQRRRRNRTTDEMTGQEVMKTSGKFEVYFGGYGKVEVDHYSRSTYMVNGVDMFRPDSGGRDCFDRAGFIQLEGLAVGKSFSLTIPSGQLAGRITEVRLESRDLRAERGLTGFGLAPITTLVIDGAWVGARNGLLNGDSAAASFRPLDGPMGAEWDRRAQELAATYAAASPATV